MFCLFGLVSAVNVKPVVLPNNCSRITRWTNSSMSIHPLFSQIIVLPFPTLFIYYTSDTNINSDFIIEMLPSFLAFPPPLIPSKFENGHTIFLKQNHKFKGKVLKTNPSQQDSNITKRVWQIDNPNVNQSNQTPTKKRASKTLEADQNQKSSNLVTQNTHRSKSHHCQEL